MRAVRSLVVATWRSSCWLRRLLCSRMAAWRWWWATAPKEFTVKQQGIAAMLIACWLSSSVHCADVRARRDARPLQPDPGHRRRSGPQRGRP